MNTAKVEARGVGRENTNWAQQSQQRCFFPPTEQVSLLVWLLEQNNSCGVTISSPKRQETLFPLSSFVEQKEEALLLTLNTNHLLNLVP